MKFFDNENRLGTDECARNAKDYQNSSINDYNLWNVYNMDCAPGREKELEDFATKNLNLHYRNGVGYTNSCYVDNDTEMRNNGLITNEKAKCQLFTRFYQANPDLSKGKSVPNVESRLIYSEDTTQYRQCHRLGERDFERFVPLIPCIEDKIQDPDHIVLPFNQGGENSREMMRSAAVLKKCGYKHNGKAWLREDKVATQ
jgi:hypothetical protein